jgi:hypothetical protein
VHSRTEADPLNLPRYEYSLPFYQNSCSLPF